jgi:hypothetical protein
MATEQHSLAASSHGPVEPLTTAQEETLRRAVAKVVELGVQTGVTTDEMIHLLDSGAERRRTAGLPGGAFRRSCLEAGFKVSRLQGFRASASIWI